VKWKFCTQQSGTVIDKVLIRYRCSLFHQGSLKLILCNDDTCISVDPSGYLVNEKHAISSRFDCVIIFANFTEQNVFETDEFRGWRDLSLTAVMDADGRSPGSWQHAQLFRQSISDDDYPFEIDISLCDGSKTDG
jgi:hypothetical protein